jgi:predicted DNA-binding protein
MQSILSIQLKLDEHIQARIHSLAQKTGKPEETVIREAVIAGLNNYQATPTKSAKAVLDLINWAEKEHITGIVKDLSTNHNKYAWEQ